jgi:hypothetical protein
MAALLSKSRFNLFCFFFYLQFVCSSCNRGVVTDRFGPSVCQPSKCPQNANGFITPSVPRNVTVVTSSLSYNKQLSLRVLLPSAQRSSVSESRVAADVRRAETVREYSFRCGTTSEMLMRSRNHQSPVASHHEATYSLERS